MVKVPCVQQNPCSNFIFILYVSKSLVKKYDNRVKNPPYYYKISNIHQKALAFLRMIPLLNQKKIISASLHAIMNSFHPVSEVSIRLGVQGPGVFWNSVPGDTKCHHSILNSRQMAPKPGLIVHLTTVILFYFILACFRCLLATQTRILSFITNSMGRL